MFQELLFLTLYIRQPRIIDAELENYFMYNPATSDALLYITIKLSLKSGDKLFI